jgi:hypothetical protein
MIATDVLFINTPHLGRSEQIRIASCLDRLLDRRKSGGVRYWFSKKEPEPEPETELEPKLESRLKKKPKF